MDERISLLFSRPNVLVNNQREVSAKIKTFHSAGTASLQVVADFDFTLTHRYNNNSDTRDKLQASFGALECYPHLSDGFRSKLDALRDKYCPMDSDPTLKAEDKNELMKQWSNSAVELYVTERINKQTVKDAIAVSTVKFRAGFKACNDKLCASGVPLCILSAGLGTAIQLLLDHHSIEQKNIEILSNNLVYDSDGYIAGITQPLITTATKRQTHTLHPGYFEGVRDRVNVVVLGDRIEDEGVKGCFEHAQNVITVGFLNENVDELVDLYKKTYDIVLLGDPDFSFILELFDIII